MELEANKCVICNEPLQSKKFEIFTAKTEITEISLFDLLLQMVGEHLDLTNIKNHSRWLCLDCRNSLMEYEKICESARVMQEYFVKLIQSTEEKYVLESTVEVLDEEYAETDVLLEDGHEIVEWNEEDDVELFEDKYSESDGTNGEIVIVEEVAVHTEPENTSNRDLDPLRICKECNLTFETRADLQQHEKTTHQNCSFMCEVCGQSYKSKTGLLHHKRTHEDAKNLHKCPHCDKLFTQKGGLKRHLPIHTGEKPFQCDECGKQFTHYSSYYMHKLAHKGVREKTCEICGFKLASTSHLNRHMRIHSGDKPYACETCGAKFAQRYNLVAHSQIHEGITRKNRYKCEPCNKIFTKKSLLDEHQASAKCLLPKTE